MQGGTGSLWLIVFKNLKKKRFYQESCLLFHVIKDTMKMTCQQLPIPSFFKLQRFKESESNTPRLQTTHSSNSGGIDQHRCWAFCKKSSPKGCNWSSQNSLADFEDSKASEQYH